SGSANRNTPAAESRFSALTRAESPLVPSEESISARGRWAFSHRTSELRMTCFPFLRFKHLPQHVQRTCHHRWRDPPQFTSDAGAIDAPDLIEYHEAVLPRETARQSKRIRAPTGGHRCHDHRGPVGVEFVG